MKVIKKNAYVLESDNNAMKVTASRSVTNITDGEGTRKGEDAICLCISDENEDGEDFEMGHMFLTLAEARNMVFALNQLLDEGDNENND